MASTCGAPFFFLSFLFFFPVGSNSKLLDAEPNASITSHDMPSTTTAAAAPSSASTYATAADAYAYHDYDPNAMYSAHTDPTAYYQYWQQHQQEEQKQQTATDQEIDEEVV